MKKLIAAALVFVIVFVLAACKNRPVSSDETTEPTGTPGEWVTDASGNVQTTNTPYLVLDENSEPQTILVTDEDGSTVVKPVTTLVYEIQTYPPAEGETLNVTTQPTVAAGNTVASNHEPWPTDSYLSSVPKATKIVDRIDRSAKEKGHDTVIWINNYCKSIISNYNFFCLFSG